MELDSARKFSTLVSYVVTTRVVQDVMKASRLLETSDDVVLAFLIKFSLLLVVRHLFLLAYIVTTSKALVTTDAPVTSFSFVGPPFGLLLFSINNFDSDGLKYT